MDTNEFRRLAAKMDQHKINNESLSIPIVFYDILSRRIGREDAMIIAKFIEARLLEIENSCYESIRRYDPRKED